MRDFDLRSHRCDVVSCYFDNRDETVEWFESRDLQGGGYTWEALVQASFELDPSVLASDIEYDSEALTFFAEVPSKAASDELKRRIERLASDESSRLKCMKRAEEGGCLE